MRTLFAFWILALPSMAVFAAEPVFRVWGGQLAMRVILEADVSGTPMRGNENGHLIVQMPVTANGNRRLDPTFGKVVASPGKLVLCYRYVPVERPREGPSLAVAYTQIAEWSFPDIPSNSSLDIQVSEQCA
jgi:hypothetical protein